jgi:hypothetical protein
MKIIGAEGLINGDFALNKVPDLYLMQGDMAMAKDGVHVYLYRLNDNSGLLQDVPNVIIPSDKPLTTKRWLLQGMYANDIVTDSLTTNTITASVSGDITINDSVNIVGSLGVSDTSSFDSEVLPFTVVSDTLVTNLGYSTIHLWAYHY